MKERLESELGGPSLLSLLVPWLVPWLVRCCCRCGVAFFERNGATGEGIWSVMGKGKLTVLVRSE